MRGDHPTAFDAIVIGSGIGGMTAAAILAKYRGMRCLVVEQNFNFGGFTHEFERMGKFYFDVGVHYVGQMGPSDLPRRVLDYVTDCQVQWAPMPEVFEKFSYPDFTFEVSSNSKKYRDDLSTQFPEERRAIRRYFVHVKRATAAFILENFIESFPRIVRAFLRLVVRVLSPFSSRSTKYYLARHFKNPKLRALLASQWGDYGLPPSQSSFGMHALIVTHYLEGAHYPVGGAQEIPKAILPVVWKTGGKAWPGTRVTEILVKNGKAVGVRAQSVYRNSPSQEYYAPVIISDAGALNTFLKLLPNTAELPFRHSLVNAPHGYSAITLYLGLSESPEKLGFHGENWWIFNTYDHERFLAGEPGDSFYYLSFPSLKDPSCKAHTAEVIAFTDYERFARWKDQPWKLRDDEYQIFKEKITERLLKDLDERFPGFRSLVEFSELATPLTYEYFAANPFGAFYGLPCTPHRTSWPWIRSRTPIQGLYLTGSDTLAPGIVGAMMGGVKCAGLVCGPLGLPKILHAIQKEAGRS